MKKNGLLRLTEKIRNEAYSLAEKDGFRNSPEYYWYKAKSLIFN